MTENMRKPFARQVELGNKNSSWRSNQETFKNQQFHPAQNDHWRPNYMRAHIYDFSKVVKAISKGSVTRADLSGGKSTREVTMYQVS